MNDECIATMTEAEEENVKALVDCLKTELQGLGLIDKFTKEMIEAYSDRPLWLFTLLKMRLDGLL